MEKQSDDKAEGMVTEAFVACEQIKIAELAPDNRSAILQILMPRVRVNAVLLPAILQFLSNLQNLLSSDRSEAVLEVPFPVELKVDATSAAHWMGELGRLRAALLPEWPRELNAPVGVPMEGEKDTLWTIQSEVFGEVLVHVRDPRFGWRCYVLSKDSARWLGEQLIAYADRPAPAVGSA